MLKTTAKMKKKMTRLVSDLDSLKSFMDDNDEIGNDRTFYQKFENVITSIDDVSKKEYDKSIADIQKLIYLIFVKHLRKK